MEKAAAVGTQPALVDDDKASSRDNSVGGGHKDVETGEAQLQRKLGSHHLQFLAIGGTIGTGLFLGSGAALATSGPVGCLIAFIFVGAVVYSVMTSLGEMASYIPVAGSFTAYASRFVDPSLGFAMGWIYWFSWAMTFALELVAAGLIIQYWNPDLNIGIWIAVFLVLFTAINLLPVRWFGEVEMYLSSIKVVTIVGWIIFAICINAGAGRQGYIGFSAWVDPGPFAESMVEGATGKFVGFWSVLVTAGETQNPSQAVPRAIRWTFWGIFSLFVSTIFFIGLNVPYNTPELLLDSSDASASPLVIAAQLAGVSVLPDILNAVLLTAVLSAAGSNVYSGSRILVALGNEGHAPSIVTRTNTHGTPYVAVLITSAFGLLAFLNLSENGGNVFDWLLNITAIAGFITWSGILVCHLRFMRALRHKGLLRSDLPYTAPLQPYLAWFGLFFCVLILLTNGFTVFMDWNTSDFFAAYVSLILFVVLFLGHKLVFRTKPVQLADVDLNRGRIEM